MFRESPFLLLPKLPEMHHKLQLCQNSFELRLRSKRLRFSFAETVFQAAFILGEVSAQIKLSV
ncbi:MAG: hypothetical protein Q4G42_08075 [Neisseria sp.]|nr:hypothetical protein [Neisseria sp.]